MAQAARQSLRMQKELKLLLTDPPPGVSLSDSSTSLTNLNVEMKGPEGSVYANGVFHIKIQIPDRYPFQPPNVTFATPIYHPNIDTGGRICLDILNLPPKGAWQPSLNISTVLMSIGLLLSEPNPDDGLMCEASREYKYNRQTFDQKARSMTEKYAKSGISLGSGSTPAKPSPLMAEAVKHIIEPKTCNDEYVDSKRPGRVGRKLSLESSTISQKGENIADGNNSSSSHSQTVAPSSAAAFPRQDVDIHNQQTPHQDDTSKAGSESIDLCPGKLSGRPLKSSASPHIMPNHDKESPMQPDDKVDCDNGDVNRTQKKVLGIRRKLSLHSSVSKCENISVSSKSSLLPLNQNGSAVNMAKSKLRMSKKWEDDGNKENVPPNCQLISGSPTTNVDVLLVEAGQDTISTKEADNTEAVIVLDSEDSEEEVRRPARSRLSIARKPLVGKRKAKA